MGQVEREKEVRERDGPGALSRGASGLASCTLVSALTLLLMELCVRDARGVPAGRRGLTPAAWGLKPFFPTLSLSLHADVVVTYTHHTNTHRETHTAQPFNTGV